jgi:hypothetical protein
MLPDFDRADLIGEFCGYPESRAFAELLIDCEEDRILRAVLVGMLRELTANVRSCRGLPSLACSGNEPMNEMGAPIMISDDRRIPPFPRHV